MEKQNKGALGRQSSTTSYEVKLRPNNDVACTPPLHLAIPTAVTLCVLNVTATLCCKGCAVKQCLSPMQSQWTNSILAFTQPASNMAWHGDLGQSEPIPSPASPILHQLAELTTACKRPALIRHA